MPPHHTASPDGDSELPLSLQQSENLPPGFSRGTIVPILAARFGPGLHPGRLARALEAVIDRHPALRLRLVCAGGQERQRIAEPGRHPPGVPEHGVPEHGGSEHGGSERGVHEPGLSDPTRELEQVLSRPPDLAAHGPVITRLTPLPDGYAALFAVSHVSADGWSVGVLRRDLSRLYLALPGQQPPELAPGYYQRYIRQQRAAGDALTPAQAGFFRSSLRGIPALLPRRPLGTGPARSYRYLERRLAGQDVLGIFDLARRLRTTPAKILMAASFLALKAYFGQDRFGILDVSAGRTREQADWVGLLSRAVPVPVLAPDDAPAGQFIADVHRRSIRTLQQLAGPYSLKRVLALAHQSGDCDLGSALYQRMWAGQAPSSHSVMFNCLSLAPQPGDPFGADARFRPLFPAVPLAAEKARISDLDVLPVVDGTSVTIAVAAHPAVHDQAETEFVLAALERILGGWARSFDGHQPIGSYRRLAG